MNKNDLRVIKTKKIIHESLLELLKSKPLSKIKVTEFCRMAQISRGAFYLHYEEMNDVLDEIFYETMGDFESSYNAPFENGFDVRLQNLTPEMIQIFSHVKSHESFYRLFLHEEMSMKYYYLMYDAICRLIKDSSFSVFGEDHFGNAYSANAIIGLIIEWYRNDFEQTVEEMNTYLYNVVKKVNEHFPRA